ncbi:hypothetical protein [Stratiformator vulcanicus]|uniref:hypothetical protein n=1 Tax=Stratiformator vulcanicus TaxID=2527980 RepID=UPI0011A9FEA4|nr:hypothetical protein [Stratiformator vulcanicus]
MFRLHVSRTEAIVAAVTTVAILLHLVGVRIDNYVAIGGLFPCANHRCGCDSAEKCLTNCCCFSPKEQAAWAQSRGIPVPTVVEKAIANDPDSLCKPPDLSLASRKAATESDEEPRPPCFNVPPCHGPGSTYVVNFWPWLGPSPLKIFGEQRPSELITERQLDPPATCFPPPTRPG